MTTIQRAEREKRVIDAMRTWLDSWGPVMEMINASIGGEEPPKSDVPEWVQLCAERLTNTVFAPARRALSSPVFNGYNAGYAIGVMKWGAKKLDEKPPKKLLSLSIKFRLSSHCKRQIGRLIEDFFCKYGKMTRSELNRSKFIPSKAMRLHTSAGDLPLREASEYYRGFSEGLRGVGKDAPGDRSNDATDIYLILGMWWRLVGGMRSVTELHAFLVRLLGSARVGDKKRVEKICERIGLTLREPGRPLETPTVALPG